MRTTTQDPADGYLSLDDLARYSGLSERTLRRYLTATVNPLPHFKVGGRVLIRRSEFDRWIEVVGTPEHLARAKTRDQKVRDAVAGVLGRPRGGR